MSVTKIRATVAAGHPDTAAAAAAVMADGGNAVDAAIAAICTSFTAEPVLTGAGGGGFMLVSAPDRPACLLDGFARMPSGPPAPDSLKPVAIDFGDTVQTFHIGRASVASPSLPAMLFEAHRRFGCMPLREVLSPAIEAARHGIRLNRLQASFLGLLEPILSDTETARRLFRQGKNGKALPVEGELFRNPDLANTLEMLAIEGIAEMYHGDLARQIVRACAPEGPLRMRDMQAGQMHTRAPLTTPLLKGMLLTNPPPSSGGILISYAAALLERLPDSRKGEPLRMAEALHAASNLRRNGFDEGIHRTGFAAAVLDKQRLDHDAQQLEYITGRSGYAEPGNRLGSTTHISVIDHDGMAVSLTSSNGEGSGIVVPGTGIHLNNMLGEEDINPLGFHALPAGTTLSSMMAPSIFMQHGRPRLILGSGGSNRLRGAITQVLTRMVMDGEDVETAVHAPRLHNEWRQLDVEPGLLRDSDRQRLQEAGWRLHEWQRQSVYFGGVHAIAIDSGGGVSASGDPRRGGAVACP